MGAGGALGWVGGRGGGGGEQGGQVAPGEGHTGAEVVGHLILALSLGELRRGRRKMRSSVKECQRSSLQHRVTAH